MKFPARSDTSLTRRALLVAASTTALAPPARSQELPTFKVGTLAFGAVQWIIQIIVDHGFDTAAGIKVENVPVSSNEAARIAFLSGSVDSIANDLLFAARLKSDGKPVLFLPYTSTEGGLMVASNAPIRALDDLRDKTIGVAGGVLDKSWLLLQAAAKRDAGFDLARNSQPVFGAPPLLAAKIESGELDCGLLFWSYCARLQAKGYRELFTVEDIAAKLGAKGKIALGGFLLRAGTPARVLEAFGKAVHRAQALLADDPGAWAAIRPSMHAKDEATFEALKAAYLRGIPRKPRAEEIADAQSFFAIVVAIGGTQLVGAAKQLPADLYASDAVFG